MRQQSGAQLVEPAQSILDRAKVGGRVSLFMRMSHFRACILYHLYQDFSGFCRVANFSQECNASPPHPILSSQAHMKSEAVDGGHRSFLRLNARESPASRMSASLWSAFMC